MNQLDESLLSNMTAPTAVTTAANVSGVVSLPMPGTSVIASPVVGTTSITNLNNITITTNSGSSTNASVVIPAVVTTSTGTPVTVSMTVSNISTVGTTVVTATQSASLSSPTTTVVVSQQSPVPQASNSTVTRMVPLIYLQPPMSVKQPITTNSNNGNGTNNNNNNGTAITPTSVAATSIATSGAVQFTMSQIIAGNPQLIHTNSSQQNQTFAYLGTLIKQSLKGKEATSQKVLLTPMAVQNKGSQMASVILPTGSEGHAGLPSKQAMASLILQSGAGTNVAGKMGLILPGSATTNPTTGKTSLLLPAPPNSGNSKKASLANIIVPNPVKTSNVPNIIRQSSNTSTGNSKTAPVTGYILPSGSNSTGLIIPAPGVTKTNGNQVTGLIIPASTPSTGIILPSTTSNGSGQLANLIFTTTPTSLPQTTNTPVTGLIMAGNNNTTNIIVPPSAVSSTTGSCTTCTTTSNTKNVTGVFLPVSMPGQNKNTLAHHLTISNGKIHASSPDNSAMKQVGGFSALPPLQPITNKDAINKVIGVAPGSKASIFNLSDGNSVTVTAVNDQLEPQSVLLKEEKKDMSNEVEIKVEVETSNDIKKDTEKDKEKCDKDCSDESLVLDGEITMRRLNSTSSGSISSSGVSSNGADKENTSPDKQLDDEVKIEVIKQESPDKSQSVDDFDPMKVLEWDTKGVGKLPGSDLKFRMNEYGMMILHDESESKEDQGSVTSSHSERKEEKRPHKEPIKSKQSRQPGSDEIFCCEGCGCYGLFSEFLDSKFCSIACKKSVLTKIAFNKKREDDKLRELKLRRKKRKMKILENKARKEVEIRNSAKEREKEIQHQQLQQQQQQQPQVDWIKELAELRAKKAAAAQMENGAGSCSNAGDDLSKRDVFESPNMSEVDISVRSGATSPTLTDDHDVDQNDKRVPWISKSGEFSWTSYLNHCKAKPAPTKLFKDPYPYGKNGFRVGMKLEGIDPEHQSYICVLSVAEVRGYRVRLHFDGYPESHDFWVNADSSDIFQPGWCEKNNHLLHRPRGYTMENFNWNLYLKQCKAQPAPRHLFSNRNASPICPNQFRVGMKLEAVDRKNSSLVCVATVTDIIDNRLLIHFDSWGDVYDYWADPTSPYIHPVGWCKENGHELTPPNTYKNPHTFSWDMYLKETKSVAAPARAFKTRPPSSFRQGMKLEAVDKRAPHLIRVATACDVHQHQIKISFDGFPEHFGYWVDDDCPDIHPVGWASKTGHPLEPPPTGDEKTECTTPGCKGDGHIKGARYTTHKHSSVCPYSSQNMNRDPSSLPDRFCIKPDYYEVPESPVGKPKPSSNSSSGAGPSPNEDNNNSSSLELRSMKTRLSCYSLDEDRIKGIEDKDKREERRGRKRKILEPEEPSEELNRLRRDLIETVLRPGYQVNPEPPSCWTKHSTTFGLKVDWFQGDPRRWSYKQVSAFINTVHPMRNRVFLEQEIDGEALLMLTQSDLTDLLGLKLGPAIKIFNIITLLRQKVT